MPRLEGTVERILYYNETSGYTVACLNDGASVVGVLPNVQPGESIRVEGDWTNHPKYGRQFKVTRCEQQSLPTTTAGIEAYLGSDLIEGVGAIGAIRITRHFGSDTPAILIMEFAAHNGVIFLPLRSPDSNLARQKRRFGQGTDYFLT